MFKVNNINTQSKVWTMFKVNNKDTRTTPMAAGKYILKRYWIPLLRYEFRLLYIKSGERSYNEKLRFFQFGQPSQYEWVLYLPIELSK